MIPLEKIYIRPAELGDKPAILALCQHTWDNERDYIPDVLDLWFADSSGHILVADCNGQVIGMTRLVQLSGTEGWWEGLRVDRAYRRQGIARKLTDAALELGLSLGLSILRTCVSVTNAPMHPFIQRRGFQAQGDFAVYSIEAIDSPPTTLQMLEPQDCDRIWATISPFMPNERDRLFVVRGAKWQALTPEIFAQLLEQGWVWGVSDGDALTSLFIRSQMENPKETLWIGWLGGTPTGLRAALGDLRGLAHQLGFKAVGGFLPQSDSLRMLLDAVGYQFSDNSAYRVYTKFLKEG